VKKYAWIIHLVIWAVPLLYILFWSHDFIVGIFRKSDGSLYVPLLYGTLLNLFLFYGNALWLVPRYFRKGAYLQWAVLTSAMLLILTLLESFIDLQVASVYFPYRETAFWSNLFVGNGFIHVIILGASLAYSFSARLVQDEKLKQHLRREKLESELSFLKSQINPHFLFNTLNNLFSLARKNGDMQTAKGISQLAHMMRYMLYECNVELISLQKEVEYIRNYIELQKLRFHKDDRVNIDMQVKGETSEIFIAPLVLIPFVENAFKHGINVTKVSEIRINVEASGQNKVKFSISNSVHKNKTGDGYKGIGHENVTERLEKIYNGRHTLTIAEADLHYYVNLTINTQKA